MSMQLIDTRLPGHQGPVPVSTAEFQRELWKQNFNRFFLEEIAKDPEPVLIAQPRTDDGYVWFWSLHYITPNGEVAILIPWGQNWAKQDGISSDRAIAVYTQGHVNTFEIERILESLLARTRSQRALESA